MDKFLILLPRFKSDALEVLPFLTILKNKFPDSEINLLVDQDLRDQLFFLDASYRIFIVKEENKGLIGGHKFSVNLKDVFNVTHFFNLSKGLASTLIGNNFKSENRIGWKKSIDTFFYTHSYQKPEGLRIDREHVKLLEAFFDESFEHFLIENKNISLYKEDFFKQEHEKKIMTLFFPKFEPEFEEYQFWKDFLFDLKETQVNLISFEENEHFSELKREIFCIEIVGKVNSWQELAQSFFQTHFFISPDIFAARLASLCGIKSIMLTPKLREPEPYYHYSHQRSGVNLFLGDKGSEVIDDSQQLIDVIYRDLEI